MAGFDPEQHPHRRRNALNGQWILVSPHRTKRPWLGQTEGVERQARPQHDPQCYLCPGNQRVGGATNPSYEGPFAFDNDFSALLPDTPPGAAASDPLFTREPVQGCCRVLCFSPRHDLTLPELPVAEIARVVDLWAHQTAQLGERYRWVQLFENKGAVMGCSNPHPHGQVWAQDAVPNEPLAEDREQRAHHSAHGSPLLLDYGVRELEVGSRVVCQNDDWCAVVPFWAVWPFEALILPKRHFSRMPELPSGSRAQLAALLKRLLSAYDRLFSVSFPYSMGWHGAPFGADASHWLLHAHIYPPLLRSATVKKFMVGYELLAEPQRDLTPEQSAARLRSLLGSE